MNRTMPLPPESHRLWPDHLPTPFSAEQIRDACPVGRLIRIRETTPGREPTFREVRYLAVDSEGASQAFTPTDADGRPIGPPVERRSTWLDLQGHASQPADRTTLTETTVELAWGEEPAWLYVRDEDGDGETRFWFAQRHAGMPVVVESWAGGELRERREVTSTAVVGSD
jgi:hypothetical protein